MARELGENGSIDPYEVALIDRASDLDGTAPSDGNDTVTVLESEPEIMRYQVSTSAPGMLVTSEVAYPAWKAYIDGKPIEIATAFGLLRAVAIPAGTHEVEFRFESPNEVWGMALTTAAILAVGVLLAWSRMEKKPQQLCGKPTVL